MKMCLTVIDFGEWREWSECQIKLDEKKVLLQTLSRRDPMTINWNLQTCVGHSLTEEKKNIQHFTPVENKETSVAL